MKASCTMEKFSLLVKITHISAVSDISASKVFFLIATSCFPILWVSTRFFWFCRLCSPYLFNLVSCLSEMMLNFTFANDKKKNSWFVHLQQQLSQRLLSHHAAVLWSLINACAVLWRWHTPKVLSGVFLIFQPLNLVVTLLFRTVLGSTWQLVFSQHLWTKASREDAVD